MNKASVNETLQLAKLLKSVENHMSSEFEIDVQLVLKIDSMGNLEIFDGDEREGECFVQLDLNKNELLEDDLVYNIKSSYDYEIRQELVEKITEEVLPNKTVEELEGMVRRG